MNTGERIEIQGHTKVSFTPDTTMKELINKPFSHFETVVLNDCVELEDMVACEDVETSRLEVLDSTTEVKDASVIETPIVKEEPIISEESVINESIVEEPVVEEAELEEPVIETSYGEEVITEEIVTEESSLLMI